MKTYVRYFVNWAVLASALIIFIGSFMKFSAVSEAYVNFAAVHHASQRIIALLLILLAFNLRRRKRLAWVLCVMLLTLSIAFNFIMQTHTIGLVGMAVAALSLIGLLVCADDYDRRPDQASVKKAIVLGLAVVAFVFLNAIASDVLMHLHAGAEASFGESLRSVSGYILGDAGDAGASERARVYGRFVFGIFWLSVAIGVYYALRPALVGRRFTQEEKARARKLVLKYGQNPGSYLTLEDDKKLFFSKAAEGVVAYGVVADVMVVNGDPICAPEDFVQVLAEFKAFSTDSSAGCIFLGTTDAFLDEYRELGYSTLKCGEEAHFDLETYKLEGKSTAKLRQNIHHAEREGVTVSEYKPQEGRDPAIEKAIAEISAQWLTGKKSDMLSFTVGGDGLDDPMDRRYFVAKDAGGKIVAYNVFLPYAGMKGWMADVTRRLGDAPNGVTEMLVVEGFRSLHEEGAQYGSMALAPLSGVLDDEGKDSLESKMLALIYEHAGRFYGFKDLRRAKEKYGPTSWNPQYFVYSGKALTPPLAYATVAIQNPGGVKSLAKSLLPTKK